MNELLALIRLPMLVAVWWRLCMWVCACVRVRMDVWDLLVLPRRLAICNDWREWIQQMMESYYVPDRWARKTSIPLPPVAGWGPTTATDKMTFFFLIVNFTNAPSIQSSTAHFRKQACFVNILHPCLVVGPCNLAKMNLFACGCCMQLFNAKRLIGQWEHWNSVSTWREHFDTLWCWLETLRHVWRHLCSKGCVQNKNSLNVEEKTEFSWIKHNLIVNTKFASNKFSLNLWSNSLPVFQPNFQMVIEALRSILITLYMRSELWLKTYFSAFFQ